MQRELAERAHLAAQAQQQAQQAQQAQVAELRARDAARADVLGHLEDIVRALARRPTLLDVIGVVTAHNRGQFAHECWPCQYLCRETRYIAGVTQPGSIADLIFHGCRLGGVFKLLEEARKCKRDETGRTHLICAARDSDVERVRQLLRLGCPTAVVNKQNEQLAWAALPWASYNGHEAIVRELLAHGADVNIKSRDGSTPVFWASSCGHLSIVRLLCDMPGIDLAARDDYNRRTALGAALYEGRDEVAAFLHSRGAPE